MLRQLREAVATLAHTCICPIQSIESFFLKQSIDYRKYCATEGFPRLVSLQHSLLGRRPLTSHTPSHEAATLSIRPLTQLYAWTYLNFRSLLHHRPIVRQTACVAAPSLAVQVVRTKRQPGRPMLLVRLLGRGQNKCTRTVRLYALLKRG